MDGREHFTPAMHRAAFDRDERQREIVEQFKREHREGMAEERLERERRRFDWDIEGWTGDDELALYIAGSGLHRIPADEVVRLANAMLAEHYIHFETCPVCGQPDNCGDCNHEPVIDYDYDERCRRAATRQGLDEPRRILTDAGFDVTLEQLGGYVMALQVQASGGDWVWLTVDGDDDEAPYLIVRYDDPEDYESIVAEHYVGPGDLADKMRELIA